MHAIERIKRYAARISNKAANRAINSRTMRKALIAAAIRQGGGGFRDAYRAVRADNSARMGMDLVTTIIGFIIVFYVVAYTYSPLEDAGVTLKNNLGNSSISGVQNIASLPEVAILLFILLVILGLILAATRSTE